MGKAYAALVEQPVRGSIVVWITLACLLVGSTVAAAAVSPETTILSPTADQILTPGETVFTGNATDDVSVSSVKVAIWDQTTKLWWRADGSWGAIQWHTSALSSPGTPSTTWTFTWPSTSDGHYTLRAQARDNVGNLDPSQALVRFATSAAAGERFLSILFGRTQWTSARNCSAMVGAVPLDQVAATLQERGLSAVGNVVINRTSETSVAICQSSILYARWDQIASLHDDFGWEFVSAGATYANMNSLTLEQQWVESCGSLAALESHGLNRAWGLFAYPNNKWNRTIQLNVVSTCFAYGRQYDEIANTVAKSVSPWFQKTVSIDGGACNDETLACFDLAWAGAPTRYESPDAVAAVLQPQPGEWRSVQFYRFVTGAGQTPAHRWDCTGEDWRAHWTSKAEIYCFADFIAAIDRIPSDVIVTDPATVAEAWSRGDPR